MTGLNPPGFPIQKSPDQRMLGSSPRLIAACRVFLRLPAPRHPPIALLILDNCVKDPDTVYTASSYFFPFLPYSIVKERKPFPVSAEQSSDHGSNNLPTLPVFAHFFKEHRALKSARIKSRRVRLSLSSAAKWVFSPLPRGCQQVN